MEMQEKSGRNDGGRRSVRNSLLHMYKRERGCRKKEKMERNGREEVLSVSEEWRRERVKRGKEERRRCECQGSGGRKSEESKYERDDRVEEVT